MSHPRVKHVHAQGLPAGGVYVGRTMPAWGLVDGGWGNPFPRSAQGAWTRYLDYLAGRPDLVTRAQRELVGKTLLCWCAPRRCHGEVLARLADSEDLEQIRLDLALPPQQATLFAETLHGSACLQQCCSLW